MTKFHQRRSIRIREYEYSLSGSYFITVCTQDWKCLFGDIANGYMALNKYGQIVNKTWLSTVNHFPHAQLDEFVVMPNHIHGIISIVNTTGTLQTVINRGKMPNCSGTEQHNESGKYSQTVRARHAVPLQREQFGKPVPGSIPTIIRSFKSAVTKQINETRKTSGFKIWQRNYWERVIRNEKELQMIREYIQNNPAKWELDRLYRQQ